MSEKKIPINHRSGQMTSPHEDPSPEIRIVDRRPFADPASIGSEAATEEKPRYPSFVEELLAKLSDTERRFEEKRQKVDGEISRMKSRIEADFERKLELKQKELLLTFLEVLDNLERAIEAARTGGGTTSLLEGVEMTADLFLSRLRSCGVEAIETIGKPFDPNLGQALGVVPVEDPSMDGVVVEQVQSGYRLGDLLLRPAQVRVGRHE